MHRELEDFRLMRETYERFFGYSEHLRTYERLIACQARAEKEKDPLGE